MNSIYKNANCHNKNPGEKNPNGYNYNCTLNLMVYVALLLDINQERCQNP